MDSSKYEYKEDDKFQPKKRVSIYVPNSINETLIEMAKAEGISKSGKGSKIIEQYIKEREENYGEK